MPDRIEKSFRVWVPSANRVHFFLVKNRDLFRKTLSDLAVLAGQKKIMPCAKD
jgi:hypothetical protein